MRIEYFRVGSLEFDAVEKWGRQEKYDILSNYYPSFSNLKQGNISILQNNKI